MPSVWPMSTSSRGTRLTLSITSSTCWKKVPMQMIGHFCESPTPIQMMVSGTNATTGM